MKRGSRTCRATSWSITPTNPLFSTDLTSCQTKPPTATTATQDKSPRSRFNPIIKCWLQNTKQTERQGGWWWWWWRQLITIRLTNTHTHAVWRNWWWWWHPPRSSNDDDGEGAKKSSSTWKGWMASRVKARQQRTTCSTVVQSHCEPMERELPLLRKHNRLPVGFALAIL